MNTTRAPFDTQAFTYDAQFEESAVTKRLRRQIWSLATPCFREGQSLLELNGGTGTDALYFASYGVHVLTTDQSSNMTEVTQQKVDALGLSELIRARQMEFEGLQRLPDGSFDGVFSNFGGLNCATDLSVVLQQVHRVLRPGGYFISCLLNKFALWEMMAFLFRRNAAGATRRITNDALMVRLGPHTLPVRYYSSREYASLLAPLFVIELCRGLSIFSPPPGSKEFQLRFTRLTSFLLRLDDVIASWPMMHSLGDHFVFIARKKEISMDPRTRNQLRHDS